MTTREARLPTADSIKGGKQDGFATFVVVSVRHRNSLPLLFCRRSASEVVITKILRRRRRRHASGRNGRLVIQLGDVPQHGRDN